MSNGDKKFKFDNDETEVTLKPQVGNKKVKVVKLQSKRMKDVPERPNVFKPGRLVINFAGEDEDNPGQFLTTFDPPLEVRIKFTKADHDRATAAGEDLKMAYWSETTNNWELFTAAKHQYQLEFNASGQGGVGKVTISDWGDPQIAWGP